VLAPSELGRFVRDLHRAVVGGNTPRPDVEAIAERLRNARGRGLVICGLQDVDTQVLSNEINEALGNYGSTIEIERASLQRKGSDRAVESLLTELRSGSVEVLIVAGANPVSELPGGDAVS
jgi:molybdopterin-containing oxidoreductase family iron-sulfur binding subunit